MTKQEYIAKQRAMTQGVNRRLLWWALVAFGAFGAMIAFANYIDKHEQAASMGNLLGVGLMILLLGSFVGLNFFVKRQQREFGIKCRSCGKQILNSQFAIASGNCGYCGEKLFD